MGYFSKVTHPTIFSGGNVSVKEAKARIKINSLLEEAGWRFFDSKSGPANIIVENNVKLTKETIDEFGENFEMSKNGFIDFLLLDNNGFPLVVLEAKSEVKNPLVGKEQAIAFKYYDINLFYADVNSSEMITSSADYRFEQELFIKIKHRKLSSP